MQNAQPNAPLAQPATDAPDTPGGGLPVIPFAMSAKKHIEIGATHTVPNTSWAAGFTDSFDIPTFGYMSGVFLTLNATGGVNGSKTVATNPDAPWNIFANYQLTDVNGTPIINLPGYSLYLARLLGGYKPFRPDQSTYGFTAVSTGASGTGNFLMKHEAFTEFATDGLGCLPNMDASGKYHINLTYADPSVFYSLSAGEPGTLPSISVILELLARTSPPPADKYGHPQAQQPPSSGSVSYWTSQKATVLNGDNTIQLSRTGNVVRNHILIFRDANGSRANADSTGVTPPTIEFDYDAGVKYRARVDTLRQLNYEGYGFDMPSGVIAFPYTLDPDDTPGHEYGHEWLATSGSTLLQLKFTTSAAGTLEIITNDIVTPSQDIYSAAAMNVSGG